MTTPITDAVETKRMDADIPVVFGTVPAHIARRLELDRAALMDFAAMVHRDSSSSRLRREAAKAITATRANFPE